MPGRIHRRRALWSRRRTPPPPKRSGGSRRAPRARRPPPRRLLPLREGGRSLRRRQSSRSHRDECVTSPPRRRGPSTRPLPRRALRWRRSRDRCRRSSTTSSSLLLSAPGGRARECHSPGAGCPLAASNRSRHAPTRDGPRSRQSKLLPRVGRQRAIAPPPRTHVSRGAPMLARRRPRALPSPSLRATPRYSPITYTWTTSSPPWWVCGRRPHASRTPGA
jgi:hypothetical protein